MEKRKLELVVTRDENGKIEKVRIRKGSDYIYEMLPYLNSFGNIEFKYLLNESIIQTPLAGIVHVNLYGLVAPTEELLTDIRTNFLKISTLKNYYLTTHNKELILEENFDKYIVGSIKFYDEHADHNAQEYFNNVTDGLRNEGDLILSLNKDNVSDNLLYLYNSDYTKVLDVCGINEFEIQAMLSDENGEPIVDRFTIKELLYLIYNKRRLSLLEEKDRSTLGSYILNLKNKEKNDEIE